MLSRQQISEILNKLPSSPGVYIMKDKYGEVIYVGKAISLKNRVKSYFIGGDKRGVKVSVLVQNIAELDYIVTDSEVEALILESNLIKKHRPKYNISLKDDKHYPYIKINVKDEFPTVEKVRKMTKDKGKYYGPYPSAAVVNETLNAIRGLFPLRTCKGNLANKTRPCLNYHIKRCHAPCIGKISSEDYHKILNQVMLFLEGKNLELVQKIEREMNKAAEELDFEKAAKLRDQLNGIKAVSEKQKIIFTDLEDRDILALAMGENLACIQLFSVRGGKLLGSESFKLENTGGATEEELFHAFITQYYGDAVIIPGEILLPIELRDNKVIEEYLRKKRGGKVTLKVPQKGDKKSLLEMAEKNASLQLQNYISRHLKNKEEAEQGLLDLTKALDLEELPWRMECFDISNIQGEHSVASMVVFEGGRPAKDKYRKFKIKTVQGPDDFASMAEVLKRRLENYRQGDENFLPLPHLIVIDGGKGQLSAARKVMEEMGFGNIKTIALAKREEEVFLPNRSEPVILPKNSKGLYLLQRIRDEAHRFALTFHRKLRTKNTLVSELDKVPGIGRVRKKILLQAFGSVEEIATKDVGEIAAVPGIPWKVAEEVYRYFRKSR
ncbi:Excinuclease ABC subunit C [Anaerobranca californiensis DSM 14826]|jgi:excinuclease ABC subunit C|uniref:UvrABC system protein C n=1 Tax=Anaerobranca californiensis DSM 14826 TaxID=1120989 RepID=A0A1M6PDZ8_9FIRM|nr:excinuclease ABC subunit UvrC [Anaerobranca californiensis]SHK06156.1 Excinuclease ABC subunit C [Anaerobranca californiensis DSM 14826]